MLMTPVVRQYPAVPIDSGQPGENEVVVLSRGATARLGSFSVLFLGVCTVVLVLLGSPDWKLGVAALALVYTVVRVAISWARPPWQLRLAEPCGLPRGQIPHRTRATEAGGLPERSGNGEPCHAVRRSPLGRRCPRDPRPPAPSGSRRLHRRGPAQHPAGRAPVGHRSHSRRHVDDVPEPVLAAARRGLPPRCPVSSGSTTRTPSGAWSRTKASPSSSAAASPGV